MKNKVDISVIIPCYNSEKYIEKCVKSVQEQTKKDIEIIIINDGSNDNTSIILENLEKNDSRIKVISQLNQGVSKARNLGLKYAKGKYVAFIDSDDWIKENYLEKLYNIAIKYDCDIVKCEICEYKGNEHKEKERLYESLKIINKNDYPSNIYIRFINDYSFNSCCTSLISGNLFNNIEFNEKYRYAEDFLFNLSLYTKSNKFAYIPEHLYCYRLDNKSSITKKFDYEKLIIDMEGCINSYGQLYKYIKIWKMDTEKNKITNRIYKEIKIFIKKIYINNLSYKDRKYFLNYMSDILMTKNIIKYSPIWCKLLLKKRFVTLNIWCIINYIVLEKIKKLKK